MNVLIATQYLDPKPDSFDAMTSFLWVSASYEIQLANCPVSGLVSSSYVTDKQTNKQNDHNKLTVKARE